MLAVRIFTLEANFLGSLAQCKIPATGTVLLRILKNNVPFGTITFAPGSYTGAFSSPSAITFNIADEFAIQVDNTVNSVDATFSDFVFTFKGTSY
jgi:hypothetical protein